VPPEDVIERDAPADEQVSDKEQLGEKGKGKGPETDSKSELASLRRELAESRQSEKDWATAYRTRTEKAEPEEKPVAEVDPDDPEPGTAESLVNDITAKGLSALTERGIPTNKSVRTMIREEATKIARQIATETVGHAQTKATTDSRIMSEFPELNQNDPRYDPEGELFKATRTELIALMKLDPSAAKSPMALYSAARTAKATLARQAPKGRTRDEDRYEYEGGNEEENERRLRADSQGASRGRGSRETVDDENMLGPEARSVIAGMGITEKEFADQQKELGGRDGRGRFQRGRR
jgi:hypothetical protein